MRKCTLFTINVCAKVTISDNSKLLITTTEKVIKYTLFTPTYVYKKIPSTTDTVFNYLLF